MLLPVSGLQSTRAWGGWVVDWAAGVYRPRRPPVDGGRFLASRPGGILESAKVAGDELAFEVTAGDFTRVGCDLFYKVTNSRTGAEVARAKTAIGFLDYEARKILPVPDGFRKKFS